MENEKRKTKAIQSQVFSPCVKDGESSAVDDALRSNVRIAASSHLSVHRNALCVHLLVLFLRGVVGDHHAVCDDDARGVLVAREEPHRVSRVHAEGLGVRHVGEVLHHEMVLSPVLEHRAVAAVSDQLVRELSHALVEVVHDHQHDGSSLLALGGVLVDRVRLHLVLGRAETVHVNVTPRRELLGELRREDLMVLCREVAQRVLQSLLSLLLSVQHLGLLGGVRDARVALLLGSGEGVQR